MIDNKHAQSAATANGLTGALYSRVTPPAADAVRPGDLAATLLWRLGLDPAAEMRDLTGRPYHLADGEPLRSLFA